MSHPRVLSIVRAVLLTAGVIVAAFVFFMPRASAGSPQAIGRPGAGAVAAQTGGSPYALQLTRERAAAFVEANRRRLGYLPGEVLVKFRPGVSPAGQQRALMALRSRPSANALKWIGDVALLTDDTQRDARVLAQQLSEQPEVIYAEPNHLSRVWPQNRTHRGPLLRGARPFLTPNDPDYASRQWNLQALDMPRVWDINGGGDPSIVVAVIDTGITTVNQSFAFTLWINSVIGFQNVTLPYAVNSDLEAARLTNPVDFVFAAPGGAVLDMDGHGTHVSATVAEATNNALGVAGIAYRARIMPVKVCLGFWDLMIENGRSGIPGLPDPFDAGCPDDAIARGIRHAADNGARVLNISLGGSEPSATIRDALNYAVSKGAFVAIAMGNDFEDGNPTIYPGKYAESIDGAMAVASVGRSLARAYYSSTGTHNEIAAPGGDGRAGGSSGLVWQSTLNEFDSDPNRPVPRFDRYEVRGFQGTSMATPHVAGIAALIMSQRPNISPAAVEAIIRSTARDLGASGKDNDFGYGLIQPRAALFGSGIRK